MTAVDAVVQVAMPDEAQAFLDRADVVGPVTAAGTGDRRLISAVGRTVLLVRSGIGLVNATCAATAALATTSTGVLVSAGSAGGLHPDVRVGQVVVGTAHTYPGADARAFGYVLGQVPGMPAVYGPHPDLLGLLTSGTPGTVGTVGTVGGVEVRTGPMVSGDMFVTADLVDHVRAGFPDALATDMETTALAQTAHLHGVGFLAVRGISDLCGPAADADFLTHVDDAADRSATVVLDLLARLP
ncbi:5'-methylthioadenosine/S-adenosylhomocysteine nucleosidase [Cellulomonas bogoriensis]|uniref:adenosylhomocysteine nucleosidase n=1 Tax=Cellulomonas bogoriensis 69B4 = DSM 16987 TaxID=1386082 RepID=A0A0A0C254_9CELL|nr:5'-methylthioadenosine/S-adenosylhomocysteine nucleosidase [Cellulomonas bogoriensis]KGM13489.1 5'-nucleosidase [Cellulomonas bogoriensis 69B4 = DSM 16987]